MEKELPHVPYIMLDTRNYGSEQEFWNAMGKILKILTDNDYAVLVNYEDCGLYSVAYTSNNMELCDTRFVGLSYEQEEFLLNNLCEAEDELSQ